MKTHNLLAIAAVLLSAAFPRISSGQTINDNFTDPSVWSAPYAAPGKAIAIAGGRMHFTSATSDAGGAGVARNEPLLSLAENWTLQVDVHIDPFTLAAENHYADIFLGIGKTGDWFNTHVIFEFDRGWWSSASDYDIGDDVRINGVDAPGLFNVSGFTSPDAALLLQYNAISHLLRYRFDADGAAHGYDWTTMGTADLMSGTYNLNLGPEDTLSILLFGSSEGVLVSSGQACFSNLSITTSPPPPPFTWVTNNGTITITGYTGSGGAVAIPDSINGLSVTAIGDEAFNSESSVTSVTIPDSVVSIGDSAFYRCYGLTNVILGRNVTTIAAWAFSWCTNLPALTLPASVRTIGHSVFNYCPALTTVNVPDGVPAIERFTFYNCSSLTNVSLPDSIARIDDSAFAFCEKLPRIIIGKNVASIGNMAFYICGALEGVYFAGNAPPAGTDVFEGSQAVKVYYLPGTVGWGAAYADRPTAFWVLPYPVILTTAPDFGFKTNAFGFRVSWASNAYVIVERSDNPAAGWLPRRTNALITGTFYFSDTNSAANPAFFYRLRRH